MFMFALRNVLRQKTRSSLTLAAIALGVASLILAGGYIEDTLLQLREATIKSRLGHLQVYKAGLYASGGQRPFEYLIEDTSVVEKIVGALPGVVSQARRLSFSGLISNGRGDLPIWGEGIEPEPESHIGSALTMLHGRRLANSDKMAIVLGEGLAKVLKVKVGDSVDLILSTSGGAMNTLDFTIVGVFRSMSKEYDARGVQIPLPAAAELVDTAGVGALVVLLENTEQTEGALATLTARLPTSNYEVKTWRELADFFTSTEAFYKRQFAVLNFVILVMVLLSVANTVNMTLHERMGEFGIIRALGRRGIDVFRLVMVESLVLGVIGAALGVIIGVTLALLISAAGIPMPPGPNSEAGLIATIRLVPSVLSAAFALGVVGTVLASLLPARRVARAPLVEALRQAI
jgi:putative ABC transport system permease protein